MSEAPVLVDESRQGQAEQPQRQSELRTVFRHLFRNRGAVIGLVIIGLFVVASLAAPLITGKSPAATSLPNRLQPVSLEHPLGTDELGRDLLTRMLYGGRISLGIGLISVAIGIVIGVLAIATLGIFGNVLALSATQELGGIGNQVIVSPAEDTGADTLSSRDVTAVERIAEGRGEAVPLKASGAVVSGNADRTFAQLYGLSEPGALFES
ncbi:MAG: ABC transporter permease, partial [Spirochaetota bacterium]